MENKLLNISPYPWVEPMHGGQYRVNNIIKKYLSLGVEVDSIGIIPPGISDAQDGFVNVDFGFMDRYSNTPWQMWDYYCCDEYFSQEQKYEQLKNQIKEEPSIIQVEQPWLFKFAFKYASSLKKQVKLIYSSQNIEYLLKEKILKSSSSLDIEVINEEVEKVRALEEFAIKNSDIVISCTDRDAAFAKKINNSCIVLVCPNGVRKIRQSFDKQIELPSKYAIYCASGHPPNVEGLYEIFRNGLGCIAPDQKLIIVGGVCDAILMDERFNRIPNFFKRFLLVGKVKEDLMDYLISRSHLVILPINYGEGSNLKTAEALHSGKWVVGTDTAFRGFETFKKSSGVLVAKTTGEFARSIRNALSFGPLELSNVDVNLRESLLWQNTLSGISRIFN